MVTIGNGGGVNFEASWGVLHTSQWRPATATAAAACRLTLTLGLFIPLIIPQSAAFSETPHATINEIAIRPNVRMIILEIRMTL